VTVTVSAINLGTGTDVGDQVLVAGKNVGTTGTPFTHTFRTRRIRIPVAVPPEFEVVYQSGWRSPTAPTPPQETGPPAPTPTRPPPSHSSPARIATATKTGPCWGMPVTIEEQPS
jgi:hypothetical protein